MSKLFKKYLEEVEDLAAHHWRSPDDSGKGIMDVLVDDRGKFMELARNSTGSVGTWVGKLYEYLTICFLKLGLAPIITSEWEHKQGDFERDKWIYTADMKNGELDIVPNKTLCKTRNSKRRVSPDILIRRNGEVLAIIEVKSSFGEDRKQYKDALSRLCDIEHARVTGKFTGSGKMLYSIVMYGKEWSLHDTTGIQRPDRFLFVAASNLRNDDDIKETRYDLVDLIDKISSLLNS